MLQIQEKKPKIGKVLGVMLTLVLVQYVGVESLKRSSFLQLATTIDLGMPFKNQLQLMNVAQHSMDQCHQ
jgi:hypothetical protein